MSGRINAQQRKVTVGHIMQALALGFEDPEYPDATHSIWTDGCFRERTSSHRAFDRTLPDIVIQLCGVASSHVQEKPTGQHPNGIYTHTPHSQTDV